jgi:hypothetical protein
MDKFGGQNSSSREQLASKFEAIEEAAKTLCDPKSRIKFEIRKLVWLEPTCEAYQVIYDKSNETNFASILSISGQETLFNGTRCCITNGRACPYIVIFLHKYQLIFYSEPISRIPRLGFVGESLRC